jgi:exodeoxyribonuclease VII small subunit
LAKFEESLARLEAIVDRLESGDLPLEEAITLFEEGSKLASSCKKQLEEADGKVQILLRQKNGKMSPAPFETEKD